MRAKAALFDKDGTLLSFQKTWGPWVGDVIDQLSNGDEVMAQKMITAWDYNPELREIGGNSVVVSGTVAEVAAAVLAHAKGYDLEKMVAFLDETSAAAPAVEEVPLGPFLDDLAGRGLALGVGTNDSETSARAQLKSLGVQGRFDFIAGYDSGHGGKPGPGMCLAFAAHLGLETCEIVMVGDSAHDVEAGRRAGMQTVGVLSGVAGAEQLAPFADVILPDVSHLAAWLG